MALHETLHSGYISGMISKMIAAAIGLCSAFAPAAEAASIAAPQRMGGGVRVHVSPQMAAAWGSAVGDFFSSSAPDPATLGLFLPVMASVDLNDSGSRAVMEPLFRETQAAARQLIEEDASGQTAPTKGRSLRAAAAAKLAMLETVFSGFLADEQRPIVAHLSARYQRNLPPGKHAKVVARVREIAEALGRGFGEDHPLTDTRDRSASSILRPAPNLEANAPASVPGAVIPTPKEWDAEIARRWPRRLALVAIMALSILFVIYQVPLRSDWFLWAFFGALVFNAAGIAANEEIQDRKFRLSVEESRRNGAERPAPEVSGPPRDLLRSPVRFERPLQAEAFALLRARFGKASPDKEVAAEDADGKVRYRVFLDGPDEGSSSAALIAAERPGKSPDYRYLALGKSAPGMEPPLFPPSQRIDLSARLSPGQRYRSSAMPWPLSAAADFATRVRAQFRDRRGDRFLRIARAARVLMTGAEEPPLGLELSRRGPERMLRTSAGNVGLYPDASQESGPFSVKLEDGTWVDITGGLVEHALRRHGLAGSIGDRTPASGSSFLIAGTHHGLKLPIRARLAAAREILAGRADAATRHYPAFSVEQDGLDLHIRPPHLRAMLTYHVVTGETVLRIYNRNGSLSVTQEDLRDWLDVSRRAAVPASARPALERDGPFEDDEAFWRGTLAPATP